MIKSEGLFQFIFMHNVNQQIFQIVNCSSWLSQQPDTLQALFSFTRLLMSLRVGSEVAGFQSILVGTTVELLSFFLRSQDHL